MSSMTEQVPQSDGAPWRAITAVPRQGLAVALLLAVDDAPAARAVIRRHAA